MCCCRLLGRPRISLKSSFSTKASIRISDSAEAPARSQERTKNESHRRLTWSRASPSSCKRASRSGKGHPISAMTPTSTNEARARTGGPHRFQTMKIHLLEIWKLLICCKHLIYSRKIHISTKGERNSSSSSRTSSKSSETITLWRSRCSSKRQRISTRNCCSQGLWSARRPKAHPKRLWASRRWDQSLSANRDHLYVEELAPKIQPSTNARISKKRANITTANSVLKGSAQIHITKTSSQKKFPAKVDNTWRT